MIRVIVADDEPKVCSLVCQLIDWEGLGMQLVGTAGNGIEAVALAQREKPDLIITDIRMPGCSGMELIKQIREELPDIEFIVISGHSQFDYAQTAIRYDVRDYILKPIKKDTLNTALENIRHRHLKKKNLLKAEQLREERQKQDAAQMRKAFWLDFEFGSIPNRLEEINSKYHFQFAKGAFRVFLIQADVKKNEDLNLSLADNVMNLCYTKLNPLLEYYLRSSCSELEAFHQGSQIAGIINYLPENEQTVKDAMSQFIYRLSMELHVFKNIQFHLCLGDGFSSLHNLKNAVSQAERIMGQRLFEHNALLLDQDPGNTDFDIDLLYRPFNAAMRRSYDTQSGEQLAEAIGDLKRSARKYRLNGYQMLQLVNGCYRLFLLSRAFQQEYKIADSKVLETDFARNAELCSSVDNLFLFLADTCKRDLEQAREYINQEKAKPIIRAKQYIQENYAQPLSLDRISSVVGFSSSYFSTLFRKETGKTFLEYLSDVRIGEAKILLRETRMTVNAIASAVGCNDTKRFSKTFRELTGLSPKEYRKLYF